MASADRGQHRGNADPAAARSNTAPISSCIPDQIHGRSRHDARRHDRRWRVVPLEGSRRSLPDVQRAGRIPITAWSMPNDSAGAPISPAPAASINAPPALCSRRSTPSCCCRASRRLRFASSDMSRMREKSRNSCGRDDRVDWVNYVGFADNPYYPLAKKYLGGRAASLLTFGVKGGLPRQGFLRSAGTDQTARQYRRRQVACLSPASTTHRQMSPQELAKAGVTAEMIRLSIGIEHVEDIIDDLDQALGKAVAEIPSLRAAPILRSS